MPDFKDIQSASHRIAAHIHKTPVLTNRTVNALSGADVYFKCENLQKTGSFKIRGAMYKILKMIDKIGPNGVVAASAGNHAQGVALTTVYVPSVTSSIVPTDRETHR